MSLRDTLPATLTDAVGHVLGDWRARLARHRAWHAQYDRTVRELTSYTDREFADLGIPPAEIPGIARQQADLTVGRR